MSGRVSNGDLMEVLMEMKGDIGGLKADLQGHVRAFEMHVKDDKRVAEDVQTIKIDAARSIGVARGRATVWSLMGSAAGAALALAVDFFRRS